MPQQREEEIPSLDTVDLTGEESRPEMNSSSSEEKDERPYISEVKALLAKKQHGIRLFGVKAFRDALQDSEEKFAFMQTYIEEVIINDKFSEDFAALLKENLGFPGKEQEVQENIMDLVLSKGTPKALSIFLTAHPGVINVPISVEFTNENLEADVMSVLPLTLVPIVPDDKFEDSFAKVRMLIEAGAHINGPYLEHLAVVLENASQVVSPRLTSVDEEQKDQLTLEYAYNFVAEAAQQQAIKRAVTTVQNGEAEVLQELFNEFAIIDFPTTEQLRSLYELAGEDNALQTVICNKAKEKMFFCAAHDDFEEVDSIKEFFKNFNTQVYWDYLLFYAVQNNNFQRVQMYLMYGNPLAEIQLRDEEGRVITVTTLKSIVTHPESYYENDGNAVHLLGRLFKHLAKKSPDKFLERGGIFGDASFIFNSLPESKEVQRGAHMQIIEKKANVVHFARAVDRFGVGDMDRILAELEKYYAPENYRIATFLKPCTFWGARVASLTWRHHIAEVEEVVDALKQAQQKDRAHFSVDDVWHTWKTDDGLILARKNCEPTGDLANLHRLVTAYSFGFVERPDAAIGELNLAIKVGKELEQERMQNQEQKLAPSSERPLAPIDSRVVPKQVMFVESDGLGPIKLQERTQTNSSESPADSPSPPHTPTPADSPGSESPGSTLRRLA